MKQVHKPPSRADRIRRTDSAERIAPGIRVVTAPNAGPMTHTGTRSYIVGEGQVALIDPGPLNRAHRMAIESALEPGEQISHILVTHTHLDHSPLARDLSEISGAPVLAFGRAGDGRSQRMQELADSDLMGGGEGMDEAFDPDQRLTDGEMIKGNGWALETVHTPGHLSNHLCFALKGTDFLFTGDHVMGWSTTLVSPPDGDLAAFMASLHLLLDRGESTYLPGHGPPVKNGPAQVADQLEHRQQRERQILAALTIGAATPAQIVEYVYEGLDTCLHRAAARNVLAHLIDLTDRGLVSTPGLPGQNTRFSHN